MPPTCCWWHVRGKKMTEPTSKRIFDIFRTANGLWCARRADGLVCGEFFAREAAIRFARMETGGTAVLRMA